MTNAAAGAGRTGGAGCSVVSEQLLRGRLSACACPERRSAVLEPVRASSEATLPNRLDVT